MKTIKSLKMYITVWSVLLFTGTVFAQQPEIQYFRKYDKTGINVYETSKIDSTPFQGLRVRFGANFTQGYQNFNHSNSAIANLGGGIVETAPGSGIFVNGAGVPQPIVPDNSQPDQVYNVYRNTATGAIYNNSNALYQMAGGFPLAQANFNIDVQLADGVRVSLVSYMSSHHHNEFWVKGGYFQIDKVGFLNNDFLNKMWKNLTLKVGHMEINYGDQHFRRSDGGNALWNPFMENNVMDEFTTEIGAELYWQKNGIIAMIGATDGEIQGNVTKPVDRQPSIYGKLGYDKTFAPRQRARLTGSFYSTSSSVSNTLMGGDRTGSNYQYVVQPYNATLTGNAFAGRFNPGLSDNITAFMVNPSGKYNGLEFFGTWEMAYGNTAVENGEIQYSNPAYPRFGALPNRYTNQYSADLIYRFGKNESFYVGYRWSQVTSTIVSGTSTAQSTSGAQSGISQGTRYGVGVDRSAFAAGWFLTKNVLFKAEYVTQSYSGYPTDNILSGAKFDGFVIQGTIGF